MMKKFYIQANHSFKNAILTDYVYDYSKAQWEESQCYCTICSNKHTALIFMNSQSNSQQYTVNLATKSCSCMEFQNIHISCQHAIAVIRELKYAVNDFIHEAYFIISYKAIYKASFTFIDIESLSDDSDCKTCNIKTC